MAPHYRNLSGVEEPAFISSRFYLSPVLKSNAYIVLVVD